MAIPFLFSMRINRACSKEGTRDQRLEELKDMLLTGEYSPRNTDTAIVKARAIPRTQVLRRVLRQQPINNRPVFMVQFNLRLPSMPDLPKKTLEIHGRAMQLPLISNPRTTISSF